MFNYIAKDARVIRLKDILCELLRLYRLTKIITSK